MSVENDNIKFMREKERSSNASVKNISNSWQFKDDRNDPDQDRSRGCGGGGFNTPGRFVCWKRSRGADYAPTPMIEMTLMTLGAHEVVGVGGSIPLVGLFVIEEGTRNEKSSFCLYTELESIILGCFLHFLLIAIWCTSYYDVKGLSKIYLGLWR